jgi:radical SAM superfamily enzyme YgiQ (UPF0313 family)
MRVTPVTYKMLTFMKKAGCRRLMFGVEDYELLKDIQKKVTKQEIFSAFAKTKKAGLAADAYLMIFPNTSWNENEYTNHLLQLLCQIQPDGYQCNVAMPLPGTKFFSQLNKKSNLSKNWSLYDPAKGDKLPYNSKKDLFKVRKQIYLLYPFFQPKNVIKILLNVNLKNSLKIIKKYISLINNK